MKTLTCHFWNVGQGLFSSGKIQEDNNEPFVWVYDCGSTSKDANTKILPQAIARMDQEYSAQCIDLMAISHFDRDHINGLDLLLQKKTVKQWLLPYYPLWQRLVIAKINRISTDDDLFNFYVNPIEYLSTKYKPEKILISLPSDSNLISKETPEEISREILREISNLSENSNSNVIYIKSIIENDIEFVPYCVPFGFVTNLNINFSKFIDNINNILSSGKRIKDKIKHLKNEYNSTLSLTGKNKSKQRNIISLHLYISPIKKDLFKYVFSNTDLLFPLCFSLIYKDYKTAILYCGDGSLKTNKEIAQIYLDLGTDRLENIFCLQVPHHGAAENWKVGLGDTLQPNVSVFCADPNAHYKHPRPQVFFDLKFYNPILVDTNNHFHLQFI